jgi:hypothetical protein
MGHPQLLPRCGLTNTTYRPQLSRCGLTITTYRPQLLPRCGLTNTTSRPQLSPGYSLTNTTYRPQVSPRCGLTNATYRPQVSPRCGLTNATYRPRLSPQCGLTNTTYRPQSYEHHEPGRPISRSFLARCGIPLLLHSSSPGYPDKVRCPLRFACVVFNNTGGNSHPGGAILRSTLHSGRRRGPRREKRTRACRSQNSKQPSLGARVDSQAPISRRRAEAA